MENKNESINEYSKALKQAVKAFSFLGGIGIYLVVFVGICGFIGNIADEELGLGSKGKLIGIIVGFPSAIYTLYRQLKRNKIV